MGGGAGGDRTRRQLRAAVWMLQETRNERQQQRGRGGGAEGRGGGARGAGSGWACGGSR